MPAGHGPDWQPEGPTALVIWQHTWPGRHDAEFMHEAGAPIPPKPPPNPPPAARPADDEASLLLQDTDAMAIATAIATAHAAARMATRRIGPSSGDIVHAKPASGRWRQRVAAYRRARCALRLGSHG